MNKHLKNSLSIALISTVMSFYGCGSPEVVQSNGGRFNVFFDHANLLNKCDPFSQVLTFEKEGDVLSVIIDVPNMDTKTTFTGLISKEGFFTLSGSAKYTEYDDLTEQDVQSDIDMTLMGTMTDTSLEVELDYDFPIGECTLSGVGE